MMNQAISDLAVLLRTMEPTLHAGAYVYCVVPHDADLAALTPVATIAEAEGLTLILPEAQALGAGLTVLFRAAWMTLTVHSDLQSVGFTATFAGALGHAGIACNVVAGAFHDHLFVPYGQAQQALAVLEALRKEAAL